MSNKFNEMISCKDETFLSKVKRKVFNFFSSFKKHKETEETSSNNIIIPTSINLFEKNDFSKIYEKIKSGEADLSEYSEDVLYKVIAMLDDEMTANSRKIEDQMKMIDININNLKISNSSLGLLSKN